MTSGQRSQNPDGFATTRGDLDFKHALYFPLHWAGGRGSFLVSKTLDLRALGARRTARSEHRRKTQSAASAVDESRYPLGLGLCAFYLSRAAR
ncbi:hypothetical protein NXC24_PA00060 (plasmid) [Rhizobium sp. NXC24]|nr:hypothetical protein NXC24_PA00060 [Rhizobium sp. NXC24]